MRRVLLTTWAVLKDNLSNRFTLFWVVLFPLVLTVLFALIFGGASVHYVVFVYGVDAPRVASYLNGSGLFVATVSNESVQALRHGYLYVYLENQSALRILYPPQDGSLVKPLAALVEQSLASDSLAVAASPGGHYTYYSYLIAGIVGVISLSNGVFGVVGVVSGYYRDGLVERLGASPLENWEWVLSLMTYEVVIVLLSSAVILAVGLTLGFVPAVDLPFVGVLVLGTLMFSGLGAVIYGLTPKDKVFVAEGAANVLVFLLMFVSNAFYPVSQFPYFLRLVATYSPVSIVNDVVRDLILYQQAPAPWQFGAIAVLTLAFVGAGSRLLTLREAP
ncbi:ABC transporter [Sulfodiicoccus acidiphilus]|uniref:ABC transporter n=1 Tax=Sulfodiicoccus acidiphilus TaxID=1670455 RepID=A0A348B4H3_9CREN|nr:ABC transporter permease [Sulfodiicoccus acidiphilus]BBD73075.1 ABC transporter [Sulfodiicoccus acidiphilus]GGU04078.1 ABC transporter [Sulfodiicoccus acidiphilus]